VAAGMLYGSFFGKLLSDGPINSGNFDPGLLTGMLGVCFFASLLGIYLAITMRYDKDRGQG